MIPDVLKGKRIIVGVTGGIAAYKSCLIIRSLVSRGAEVRVIMTPAAKEFITPLTLSTLSGNEVILNMFPKSQDENLKVNPWHIEYGIWADLMIIAPATINTVAKISNGFADNALTAVVHALRCPLLVAPAADMDMYKHRTHLQNLGKLIELGYHICEAEEGFLASGLSGPGRMAEVDKIIDFAESIISGFTPDLSGKKILISAGPTFEDIDPVRYIGNRSSGKMGYELAKAAYIRGAEVTLISGPSHEKCYPEISKINIRSAAEMKLAIESKISENQILIMSAAVADYKPLTVADKKIKKESDFQNIPLTETEDILASIKKEGKIVIGFALETNNEIENASSKLKKKNLDLIVLNSLKDEGAAFEHPTNKVSIISRTGNIKEYPILSKFQTANNILSEIVSSGLV
ncbi:MAG: bifunctional phosphopantothenoylcysteine decarboxylase/phosphopantothenate--cysteine ligase CoaBC [Bacteroidetes bacterium]|nr:bifunctional phosphopantothenoylcysteine decarboxylase/phosphopantothenate--cysteine ligase CoaBC [Bacteroidota bacterium]